MDTSTDKPIIGVSHDGRITAWNAAAQDLYGHTASDIIGQPIHLIFPLGPVGRDGKTVESIENREALHKTADGRFVVVDLDVEHIANPPPGEAEYQITIDRVLRRNGTEIAEAEQLWTLAVVETAVEGIVTIGEGGAIDYMNPAAENLFGYKREEAVGKNVKLLMPPSFAVAHDGYLASYIATGERKIIGMGRDVMGQRKDGTNFPIHLAVSEVWIGETRIFTGIIHDMSQQRKAQSEKDHLLGELNRRNRELTCLYRLGELARFGELDTSLFGTAANHVHNAVSLPDVTGTRITFDERVYSTEAFQETPWSIASDIVAEDRHRGAVEVFYLHSEAETSFAQEKSFVDTVAELLGGTIERREAEAKVLQASKLASVGELAAGVGHEINNPVNGIINCAQLLQDILEEGTKEIEFAQLIHSEGERIAKIVHSLLAFARQDKTQHSLAALSDIVEAVLSLSRKKLSNSHVILKLDIADDLPRFRCRSEQLQQVLMNLVINAMHALDDRYPGPDPNKLLLITASHDDDLGNDTIRISVEDHGSGVAPAHIERIFDPFFTTKGRDKGTGLGLSVSDGIVKEHGGTLRVDSHLGEYTRFTIELPANQSPANQAPQDGA